MNRYQHFVLNIPPFFSLLKTAPAMLLALSCSNGILNSGVRRCQDAIEAHGLCWELSEAGESCSEACADLGGADSEAALYVGTALQGGSRDDCEELFNLLLQDTPYGIYVASVAAPTNQGLGCYTYLSLGGYAWIKDIPFDPEQHFMDTRMVCGCTGLE